MKKETRSVRPTVTPRFWASTSAEGARPSERKRSATMSDHAQPTTKERAVCTMSESPLSDLIITGRMGSPSSSRRSSPTSSYLMVPHLQPQQVPVSLSTISPASNRVERIVERYVSASVYRI